MEFKIELLELDQDIYPRKQYSQKTIDAYIESLNAGAEFPPIEVQQILVGKETKTIILDGVHRWEAFKKAKKETITTNFWKDEILNKDKPEDLNELRLRSASLNSIHGDRLNQTDKNKVARAIFEKAPDKSKEGYVSQDRLAKKLNVTQQLISTWVEDIIGKFRAKFESMVYRLDKLGWTEEEIGNKFERTRQAINEIKKQKIQKLVNLAFDLHKRGNPIISVASELGLDLTTCNSILMEGKSDIDRLGFLNESLRPYDVWNFADCNDLMGQSYEGRIPGQILLNMLYFYTEPKELLTDMMAGGGTTLDACLLMDRGCLGYDAHPIRDDIIEWNLENGLPDFSGRKKKPTFAFFDPPYFKKKEREYGNKSISRFNRKEYLQFFEELAKQCKEMKFRIGFLMSDWTQGPNDEDESIFLWHYVSLFEKAGYRVLRRIQCPLSTQTIHPDYINKFRESRSLGRLGRDLVIFI